MEREFFSGECSRWAKEYHLRFFSNFRELFVVRISFQKIIILSGFLKLCLSPGLSFSYLTWSRCWCIPIGNASGCTVHIFIADWILRNVKPTWIMLCCRLGNCIYSTFRVTFLYSCFQRVFQWHISVAELFKAKSILIEELSWYCLTNIRGGELGAS